MRIKYEACVSRLKALLGSGQRSREDVEDLIHEAILRLLVYCDTCEIEVRSEEDFLRRTAKNLAINESLHNALVVFADEPVEQLVNRQELTDSCAGPERVLAAEQCLDLITRTLDAICPLTRKVFFAQRGGYTYREIATVYGIRERVVEEHIATAVLVLMQLVEPL